MAYGPAPIELLRRLESVCAGEPADAIIFCLGIVMGRLIAHTARPEDHREIVEACVSAIQAGIAGVPTEH